MKTIQELNDMEPAEFSAYFRTLSPAQEYLEMMRWLWSTEPWKDLPGGWSWEIVMQGYENLLKAEVAEHG